MKHKKLVITFSIIGGLLLGVLGAYIGLSINGSAPKYDETAPNENSVWMDSVKDETLLKDVVMPGSHDAMTLGMNYMVNTQSADMEQTLAMGARYLDLRVNQKNGKLVIFHSIIDGMELQPCLEKAKQFLLDHPSETLILDFQHFEGDAEEPTYQMLHDVFPSPYLIDKGDSKLTDCQYVANLTLGEVRGKVLALWGDYHYGEMADSYSDIFARENNLCTMGDTACISYYWAAIHKKSSEEFIKESIPEQFDVAKKAKEKNELALFVLQSQLTDGSYILGPYAREKEHDENMSKAIKSLASSEHLSLTNIIMRDFLNLRKCGEIIHLNEAKNQIKEEKEASFQSSYSCYAE